MEIRDDFSLFSFEKVMFFLPFAWLFLSLLLSGLWAIRLKMVTRRVFFFITILLAAQNIFGVVIRLNYRHCRTNNLENISWTQFWNDVGHCWHSPTMYLYLFVFGLATIFSIVIFVRRNKKSPEIVREID